MSNIDMKNIVNNRAQRSKLGCSGGKAKNKIYCVMQESIIFVLIFQNKTKRTKLDEGTKLDVLDEIKHSIIRINILA